MGVRVFCIVFISVILLCAGAACAMNFSADMVSQAPQGSMTAKLYVSGQKSRVEMPGGISISRMDKRVAWVLMPQQGVYIEQPIDTRTAMSTQDKVEGEIERAAEGRETVNGMATTKYRVTFETDGRRESVFQWIDDANHFPVKTAAIDGSWSSEFRNIKTGLQDPALFELPSGYKKMSFSMPDIGAMMQNAGE